MKFEKYSSIENSYREKTVAACKEAIQKGVCTDDFVVEEKAHGANFAFYYDGKELKTASRNRFLEDDGKSFYQSDKIKAKYTDTIKNLYGLLKCCSEEGSTLRVVGEFIGGSYEHPDVERCPGLTRVQKGVDYCPGHEFYAFDLSVSSSSTEELATGDDNKSVATVKEDEATRLAYHTPVDKLEMNRLFAEVGFLYAKPLLRGTLEECLTFSNTFKTTIPGELGLPEHPGPNLSEGKVIKPVHAAILSNGEPILLKDKSEGFVEVWRAKKTVGAQPQLSESGVEVCEILCRHVTANRLANVISKLEDQAHLTLKDLNRVLGIFTQDALEDFRKDHGEDFDALSHKDTKMVKKRFRTEARDLVKKTLSGDSKTAKVRSKESKADETSDDSNAFSKKPLHEELRAVDEISLKEDETLDNADYPVSCPEEFDVSLLLQLLASFFVLVIGIGICDRSSLFAEY